MLLLLLLLLLLSFTRSRRGGLPRPVCHALPPRPRKLRTSSTNIMHNSGPHFVFSAPPRFFARSLVLPCPLGVYYFMSVGRQVSRAAGAVLHAGGSLRQVSRRFFSPSKSFCFVSFCLLRSRTSMWRNLASLPNVWPMVSSLYLLCAMRTSVA